MRPSRSSSPTATYSLAWARAPRCAADYQAKMSGPLLDRIDLHVEVLGVSCPPTCRRKARTRVPPT